ncbi:hypothetical protein GGE06_003053 [Streptomyces sp. SFB5A]|uniref:Uncharacterized protein n=1 Tax=Streptomyces nymphaeiformis TaxID=2663842 RepID=A0A7W7XCE1_9ACTN|nr:hypothetical protein [Streptomyces nymphaeiformis]
MTLRMTRDTWVTADFAGDTRSGRAHVGSTVDTRAGLTTAPGAPPPRTTSR